MSDECRYCGWPLALTDRDVEHRCPPEELIDRGAAIAFGLVGMATALRARYPVCPFCGEVGAEPSGIYLRCSRGHSFQDGPGPWM